MADQLKRPNKLKTIHSFFKKKEDQSTLELPSKLKIPQSCIAQNCKELNMEKVKGNDCECDLGLRKPIKTYDANKQDEIWTEYNSIGPCRPILKNIRKHGMELNIVDFKLHGSINFLG